MNKQEFQQTIKNMKPLKFFTAVTINEAYEAGFKEAKSNALCNSCFLNEPEKPVVPQFVADWYEENKEDIEYNLYKLCIDFREQKLRADLHGWFNDDNHKCIETLVKMKLYGYEVEKEKLYTARLKLISVKKYSYINREKDEKELFISDSDGLTDVYQTHFTQAELEELDIWDNPAFEIEEVEK